MDQNTTTALLKDRLNRDPRDVDAAVRLGNWYYDQGDAAQAILYYNAALQVDPNQPGVWTDMGAMYWRNDNLSLAEQAFRAAIKRAPDFGFAYVNLGLLLLHAKGDLAQARQVWTAIADRGGQDAASARAHELLREHPHVA